MIIVSDTSAITSLLQIGRLDILESLFESVVVPTSVETELLRAHEALPLFIRVVKPPNTELVHELMRRLDAGESEAIALMVSGHGDMLLIDERRGREIAKNYGVRFTGLLGVLAEARRRHMIDSFTKTVDDIERVSGFRVSKALKLRIKILEDSILDS